MMTGAAVSLFPVLLPAVGSQEQDITIERAVSSPHTLRVGLAWWSLRICLALLYSDIVYWLFRGKVPIEAEGLRSLSRALESRREPPGSGHLSSRELTL